MMLWIFYDYFRIQSNPIISRITDHRHWNKGSCTELLSSSEHLPKKISKLQQTTSRMNNTTQSQMTTLVSATVNMLASAMSTTGNDVMDMMNNTDTERTTFMNFNETVCSRTSWERAIFKFSDSWLNVFDFVYFGVFMLILSILGVIGNFLSIIVLRKPVVESVLTPYLITLAICDNFAIVTLFMSLFAISLKSVLDIETICGRFEPAINIVNIYFSRTSQAYTGFLTSAITITRYYLINSPFSTSKLKSSRFSSLVCSMILIISPVISISVLFKYELRSCYHAFSDTLIQYRHRTNVFSPSFSRSESVAHSAITVYLPWACVALFNFLLIYRLCEARKARQSMTTNQKTDLTNKTTSLLFCVTISYMVLFFPSIVNSNIILVKSNTYIYTLCRTPDSIADVRLVGFYRTLTLFNSSINIIFYAMFGANFRQGLLKLFRFNPK